MTQERQAWERLPDETPPAWAAFTAYLTAGTGRSVTGVGGELHKSRTLIGRWSSRHQWVRRSSAFDAHVASEYRAEIVDAQRSIAHRHLAVSQAALTKVARAVDGIDAGTLTVAELVRLWEIAARTEREALQTPIRVQVTGADGGPIEVSLMSDEDRHARLLTLRREINMRLSDNEEQQ